ncbi:DUF6083 domain-containing protein [Streptomyces sp. JCM 35825]|uniref:DUF6083 domain-containing protein n=1 Tax=Streptomyces sp. JCM 35825 TaxID=2930259 RepID=UPI002349DCFD|nr:DUF6083 domain-containing protein [Streptomyces sp. JCM 35825]WCL89624.1 DUF6083 domain-containing protein [Streptomyces sp. JCM 35825]
MHPHPPTVARHWDGSLATRRHRSLRVSATSPSRLLRTGQHSRCHTCGNRIEWYQRNNHRPIALHPTEFANTDVPDSCRWHLSGGIAYRHSDHSAWCRTPHAILCPRRTITTRLTPHLQNVRRQLAVRTRTLIDTGLFTPPAPAPTLTPRETAPDSHITRPVVQLLYTRYLADHPLHTIRCVAQTRTRHRCPHPILDPTAPAGAWTLLPANPRSTRRQLALADGLMAIYDLSHLPYIEQLRWRTQRCPAHATAHSAADLALTTWQVFDPLLHHHLIHTHLPAPPPSGRRTAGECREPSRPSWPARPR